MEATGEPVDLSQHDLSWMLADAVELYGLGRKCSALLLLLCAVDALAKRAKPQIPQVGNRFLGYLGEKLPQRTRIQNFNILVPQRGSCMRLEEILYKYLRNPMVHEGAHLDVDIEGEKSFAVYLDWSEEASAVDLTRGEGIVVLGGDWIVNCLAGVVADSMAEVITSRPS